MEDNGSIVVICAFMTHYICKGECGGVSGNPGVCMAEQCSRKDLPLEKCDCPNKGAHEHLSHEKRELETEEEEQ